MTPLWTAINNPNQRKRDLLNSARRMSVMLLADILNIPIVHRIVMDDLTMRPRVSFTLVSFILLFSILYTINLLNFV